MAAERSDKNLKEAWDRVEVKARRSVRPSEALRKMMLERDLAKKRGKVKYRQLRNKCTKLTRAEQMRSEVNKMKEGDGKVWQTVNKLTNPGKGSGVVIKENGQYVSDAFDLVDANILGKN
jgi:DNA polymerase III delta prime subunit